VGPACALLDLAAPAPAWAPRLDGPTRRVTVVDPLQGAEATRTVVEFRPRREQVLSLAVGDGAVRVGTSEGLYVDGPDGLTRLQVPCRLAHRQPGRVVAVAARAGPLGTVAVLGFGQPGGGFRPAGVLDIPTGESYRCLEPGLDVPDAPALAVAVEGEVTWLATHAGLARLQGDVVDLLDPLSGAPDVAVTAVTGDGRGGCWAGTWGAGVFHLRGESWTLYSFRDGSSGRAVTAEGRLR
jgi:ligand-binding sensor domain-containing protein